MYKIVVIADNPFLRLMISDLLTIEGHDVTLVDNNSQSLRCVKGFNPDLILCSIDTAQPHSHETLRQLRKDVTTSDIPFAFLMAESFLKNQFFIPELESDRVIAITAELIDLPKILVNYRNNCIDLQQLSLCNH